MTTGLIEKPNYVNYAEDNSKIGISSTRLFLGISRMYDNSKKFLEYDISCFEKSLGRNNEYNRASVKGVKN